MGDPKAVCADCGDLRTRVAKYAIEMERLGGELAKARNERDALLQHQLEILGYCQYSYHDEPEPHIHSDDCTDWTPLRFADEEELLEQAGELLEQAEAENEIMRRKLDQYRLRLEEAILAGTQSQQAFVAKEVWLSMKNLLPCVTALAANRIKAGK